MNEIDYLSVSKLDEFAAYAHKVKQTPGVEIIEGPFEDPHEFIQPNAEHGVNPELYDEGDR